jgi:hypothetical protein
VPPDTPRLARDRARRTRYAQPPLEPSSFRRPANGVPRIVVARDGPERGTRATRWLWSRRARPPATRARARPRPRLRPTPTCGPRGGLWTNHFGTDGRVRRQIQKRVSETTWVDCEHRSIRCGDCNCSFTLLKRHP